MPSVGTAYVNIRVNTRGFDAGLDSLMKRLSTKMEKAGADLGNSFEKGLTSGSARASAQVTKDIDKITDKTREAKGAVGDLSSELKGVAASSRGINLSGLGGGGGGGLRKTADDAGWLSSKLSELTNEAGRNRAILTGLFDTAAFGGTALAGLAGGLSGAAQGVFAIGANAAAAAPAVAILTNGLIGLAQVGGVAAIASKGVGEALKLGFDSAEKAAAATGGAVAGMGAATASAARAVRDAKEALQDAFQDAARAAEDAARRTADAERALAAAQQESAAAQRELNAARKEALEQLEDIAFAAEDAGIAEERAALALQDAHAELLAVSGLPPDDRARIEAELAFREAELNMRQAKDARQDADKDQRQAAKNGVEGTEAMIDAREKLADAQERERDAARDLNDARREEARTAEDNAERIADAQQAVADAQASLADAQKKGTSAMTSATTAANEFESALDKLGPQQREFVRKILGMQEPLRKFRNAIAEELFTGLNDALDTLIASDLLGTLQTGLEDTAGVMGDLAVDAADLMSTDIFKARLGRIMEDNNDSLVLFGEAGIDLADAFTKIADAAGPLLRRFARFVADSADAINNSELLEDTAKGNAEKFGNLEEVLGDAGDRISEFWGLAKELWRTLFTLGRAANAAANGFTFMDSEGKKQKGYIPSLTESLSDFNDKLEKNPDLIGNFDQALKNLNATGRAFKNVIIDPLMTMGQDPAIEEAFNTIAESDAFSRLAKSAGDAVPELADLVVSIADILADMSESGAIEHFLDILGQVAEAAADLTGILNRSGILKYTGYITGAVAALRILWRVTKLASSPFVAMTKGFQTYMANVKTARKSGKGLFGSVFGSVGKAAPGVSTVAGAGAEAKEGTWEAEVLLTLRGIQTAIIECCATMSRAMAAGAAGGAAPLGAAPRAAGAAGGAAAFAGAVPPPAATGKIGKFASIFGKLGKVMGPVSKLMKPLSFGIKALGFAFRFALGPIGLIVLTLLPLLWPLLQKLEEKTGIFSKTLDVLTDAFGWLWDKIKLVFGWIIDNWDLLLAILIGPFGLAFRWIIQHWGELLDFVKKIPGRVWNFLKGMWRVITEKLGDAYAWVRNKIADILAWLRKLPDRVWNGLKTMWDVIKDKLGDAYQWVRNKVAAILTWVGGLPRKFWDGLKTMWDVVKDKLGDAWDWVVTKWANIKRTIAGWPGDIKAKLAGLWNGMGSGLISAINWVGDKVNWLIDKLNGILGKFKVPKITLSWPKLAWTGFAQGGPVFGPGTGTSDSVPARLSRGEHVLTAREVQAMGGHGNIMKLRKAMLRGEDFTGTGGIIGWFSDKFDSLTDALKKGAEVAFKWVLSEFKDLVGPQNDVVKMAVVGALDWAADKITGLGKKEDKEAAAAAAAAGDYSGPVGKWMHPLGNAAYVITTRPNDGGHTGADANAVDMALGAGNKIFSVSAGRVASVVSSASGYGNYVIIAHAGGESSLYAHMQHKSPLKVGQIVKPGTFVGYVDSTGNSTGNHLHFELDPNSDTIAAMRKHGINLGSGGVLAPSPAGTLAVLAEAGKHERVTPLDSEGFTPAERKMLEALEAQFEGSGDTYNIHPSQKLNEQQLADMVARRVAWKRRRGRGSR